MINKCLIITNIVSIVKNIYSSNLINKINQIDTVLFYDSNLNIINDPLLNYPLKLNINIKKNIIYSSFNIKIYLQFLINLKNNNEEIFCAYGENYWTDHNKR